MRSLFFSLPAGYAWSGGGCKILRVDITADKGKMWYTADIVNQEDAAAGRCWSWVLWKAEIPIDKNLKQVIRFYSTIITTTLQFLILPLFF